MWNLVPAQRVTLAVWVRVRKEEPVGRGAAIMVSVATASAALLTVAACSSGDSKAASWKPVEFRGVQVEIPIAWKPVRSNECGFQYAERYPDSTSCDRIPGVRFYGRALFDP